MSWLLASPFATSSPATRCDYGRSISELLCESMTQTDRIAMVRQYLKHFDLAIDQSSLDAEDKAMARHEDRQGLGLTRRA
jgi:hypothetical protein